MDIFEELLGERVKIEWFNDEGEFWSYFELVGYTKNILKLKGVYDPDIDTPHDGDIIYAHLDTISLMNKA